MPVNSVSEIDRQSGAKFMDQVRRERERRGKGETRRERSEKRESCWGKVIGFRSHKNIQV